MWGYDIVLEKRFGSPVNVLEQSLKLMQNVIVDNLRFGFRFIELVAIRLKIKKLNKA